MRGLPRRVVLLRAAALSLSFSRKHRRESRLLTRRVDCPFGRFPFLAAATARHGSGNQHLPDPEKRLFGLRSGSCAKEPAIVVAEHRMPLSFLLLPAFLTSIQSPHRTAQCSSLALDGDVRAQIESAPQARRACCRFVQPSCRNFQPTRRRRSRLVDAIPAIPHIQQLRHGPRRAFMGLNA